MRKSPAKTSKTSDLELRWVPGEAERTVAAKSRYPAVQTYLDFLEEFPPAPKDSDPIKVFPERFVL
jgi:hypothetical protein